RPWRCLVQGIRDAMVQSYTIGGISAVRLFRPGITIKGGHKRPKSHQGALVRRRRVLRSAGPRSGDAWLPYPHKSGILSRLKLASYYLSRSCENSQEAKKLAS